MTDINVTRVVLFVGGVLLVWFGAGYAKLHYGLRTGDARKINHACSLIGGALWFAPLEIADARASYRMAGLILFGLLLIACRYQQRAPWRYLFWGYARASDAPHAAFHVWFSWLVSFVGICLVDVLFADWLIVVTAALLLGIADGLGEPIGMRFGKHAYRVPALVSATAPVRTLEGSGAVLIGSFLTALLCFWCTTSATPVLLITLSAGVVAALVTGVEALTPHGLDNLTIPVCAAVAMWLLSATKLL